MSKAMPSYQQLDYRIRPAKNIERKMMFQAFQRLVEFASLDSYRYVGFGSLYFSDFVLAHRGLGIQDLVSIEEDAHSKERFEANKPFKCVTLVMGKSNDVIPLLKWDVRSIVWLDYDGALTSDVLADIGMVCTRALSGSVLVVTVNVRPGEIDNRLGQLRDRVGEEHVPLGLRERDLRSAEGLADVSRNIIDARIKASLIERNGLLSPQARFEYSQIFNFRYRDGAPLLTIGGVLYDLGTRSTFSRCNFGQYDFVRVGAESFTIEAPKLTLGEIRYLNSELPTDENTPLRGIPDADVRAFSRIYRYFPAFTEAEI